MYYEKKEFIGFIDEKYFEGFKKLIHINNVVSYEELTTKILSNCGKEKIVHLGDKIFIDEHIQKLEKLIIVRKEKARRKS